MAKLMKIAQIGFVAFAEMIWTGDAITVTPQGNVVFKDSANVLCTVPLNNVAATCSTSSLSVGSHSITATYSGVTSSAVNQVGKHAPRPWSNAYFAANGLDSNPCTQAAPCLTLDKASAMSYPPGSIINFRGGDTFTGCWFLDPTNVPTGGISSNPIIIQSYGTGRASWIANCPGRFQALFVSSQVSGVIIQNLKLSSGGTQTAVGIGIEGPGDTIIAQDIEVSGFNYNRNGNWGGEIFVASFGSFRRRGCNALNNVQVINSQLHGEQGATSPDAFGISGNGCDSNISNAVYKGNTVY